MSVLENLWIIISSNAKDVEKGADEAKKATDKLTQSLTKSDDATVKIGKSFLNAAKQFAGLASAFISVGAVINGIRQAAAYSLELGRVSEAIGVNASALDAWGSAVEKVGGSSQNFYGTLKSISRALNEVDINGMRPASLQFAQLGIRVTDAHGKLKNIVDLLPEISDAFQGLSKARAANLGQKLGLDESTILLLQRGRKEIEAIIMRQKELGLVTTKDTEISKKFNEQWIDTGHAFRSLFTAVNSYVLPPLTLVLKTFEKLGIFFREHSNLIIGALIGIGTAALYYVVPAVYAVVAPFFALAAGISAAIALVAIIYDDIKVFSEGGESVLGEFVKKWPALGEAIKAVSFGFSDFWKNLIIGFAELDKILGGVIFSVATILGLIGKSGDIEIPGARDVEFNRRGNIKVPDYLPKGLEAFNFVGRNPIAAQTSTSLSTSNLLNTNSKTNNIQTGPINVQTQATDAEGIAAAIGGTLNDHLTNTMNQFSTGRVA